ncbi:MAG: arylesterase [Candidatus Tectomicrobia bacterium]|nr:arylesterase [Candidatus Tectomicrobia bacterium]
MFKQRWKVVYILQVVILALFILFSWGCTQKSEPPSLSTPRSVTTQEQVASTTNEPVILALGDSLTAGFGVDEDDSYPALLQRKLTEEGYHYRVVNAGVSGDTTAGGLRRLDWLLQGQVDILIVELGANDGLRGLTVDQMRSNLAQIIEKGKTAGAKIVLAGLQLPPNYGADYATQFKELFPGLADRYQVALIPFFLEGVAAQPHLNLADGIHPNKDGYIIIAEHVLEYLKPLLRK